MAMWKWLLLAVGLAGCASTHKSPTMAGVSESDVEIVCVYEKQVGSHFSRRICRTKQEMERDRREAAELMDRTRAVEETVTPVE